MQKVEEAHGMMCRRRAAIGRLCGRSAGAQWSQSWWMRCRLRCRFWQPAWSGIMVSLPGCSVLHLFHPKSQQFLVYILCTHSVFCKDSCRSDSGHKYSGVAVGDCCAHCHKANLDATAMVPAGMLIVVCAVSEARARTHSGSWTP